MSKAVHQISVKAVDQTAGAFSSIQARAAAASAKLQSMLGGALAAAGAYLGFRQITAGINELGKLSDMAASCATSTDDLTKTMLAMQVVGVNTDLSVLTRTFAKLQKETGEVGMEAFINTMKRLSQIEDPAQRASEAMRVMGRSGADFLKIINGGSESVDALFEVANAMPVIPQAAADAGDAVADAMTIAAGGVKSLWVRALQKVCEWFDGNFTGGVREAAAKGAEYLVYYAKVGVTEALKYWEKMTTFFEAVGSFWGTFFSTDGSISEKWNRASEVLDDELEQRAIHIERLEEEVEKKERKWLDDTEARVERIGRNFNKSYDRAGKTLGSNMVEAADEAAKTIKSAQIKNSLINAGSNELSKLQILGPQYQSEAKKQTKALEEIAKNTRKTADNTSETASGDNFVEM